MESHNCGGRGLTWAEMFNRGEGDPMIWFRDCVIRCALPTKINSLGIFCSFSNMFLILSFNSTWSS